MYLLNSSIEQEIQLNKKIVLMMSMNEEDVPNVDYRDSRDMIDLPHQFWTKIWTFPDEKNIYWVNVRIDSMEYYLQLKVVMNERSFEEFSLTNLLENFVNRYKVRQINIEHWVYILIVDLDKQKGLSLLSYSID